MFTFCGVYVLRMYFSETVLGGFKSLTILTSLSVTRPLMVGDTDSNSAGVTSTNSPDNRLCVPGDVILSNEPVGK